MVSLPLLQGGASGMEGASDSAGIQGCPHPEGGGVGFGGNWVSTGREAYLGG